MRFNLHIVGEADGEGRNRLIHLLNDKGLLIQESGCNMFVEFEDHELVAHIMESKFEITLQIEPSKSAL